MVWICRMICGVTDIDTIDSAPDSTFIDSLLIMIMSFGEAEIVKQQNVKMAPNQSADAPGRALSDIRSAQVYWEVPMSTAKLQRILRFRMGSHLLPIEQGRHLRLPRHRRVCRLCHTGALGDERHMLPECSALADLRDKFSPLVAECSGVMARLVWARNQPMVSRYIIACLDRMSC